MLEPCEGKLSCTVLRGEEGREPLALPGLKDHRRIIGRSPHPKKGALGYLGLLRRFFLGRISGTAPDDEGCQNDERQLVKWKSIHG